MANKIKKRLKKLQIRKQVTAIIIRDNNNGSIPNKQKQRTKKKLKVDKTNAVNKSKKKLSMKLSYISRNKLIRTDCIQINFLFNDL